MDNEWVEWHRQYGGNAHLTGRLPLVQARIREALDRAPPGPFRVLSLCSGDGRDLLGVLADHPRRSDVRARLVDGTQELVDRGRKELSRLVLPHVEFVLGDASVSDAGEGIVPADLVLACGIFGNVTDEDVRNTVVHLPELCARRATVVWTRGRFEPDLTPTIRDWFREAGFEELAFDTVPGTTASVGANRLVREPAPYRPGVRLFTFLPTEERPSSKAKANETPPGSTRSSPLRTVAWDRFWTEVHPPENTGPGQFTRWTLSYLRSAGARTVLDLGCGPGRDMGFLLKEGFRVTGVDGSAVAVALATKALEPLEPALRARARLVRAELLEFLSTAPDTSFDAVHAAATYQGLDAEETRQLFDEVYRVLVPGGIHAWSVRSASHAGAARPEAVAPNFPSLGFMVPLHFFDRAEVTRLSSSHFENVDLLERDDLRSFYVVDRAPAEPSDPKRSGKG